MTQASLFSREQRSLASSSSRCSRRRTASSYEISSSPSVEGAESTAGIGAAVEETVELAASGAGAGDGTTGVGGETGDFLAVAGEIVVRASPFVMSRIGLGLDAAVTAAAFAFAVFAVSVGQEESQLGCAWRSKDDRKRRTQGRCIDRELDGANSSTRPQVVLHRAETGTSVRLDCFAPPQVRGCSRRTMPVLRPFFHP